MSIIIKILTAIGNSNLNNILKEENDFDILENDIFYKEGVLEFLEKNNKIDILILYEKLYGEINIIDLIKKIKIINNEINIFFILENKNLELENLLKLENIKNIFLNSEININDLIFKLKNIKINNYEKLNEEINLLKNIISKKDKEIFELKNNKLNFNNIYENNNKLNIDDINEKNNKNYIYNLFEKNNLLKNNEKNRIAKKAEIPGINDLINLNNKKEFLEDEKDIYIIIHKIKKYKLNKNISKNIIKKLTRENQK